MLQLHTLEITGLELYITMLSIVSIDTVFWKANAGCLPKPSIDRLWPGLNIRGLVCRLIRTRRTWCHSNECFKSITLRWFVFGLGLWNFWKISFKKVIAMAKNTKLTYTIHATNEISLQLFAPRRHKKKKSTRRVSAIHTFWFSPSNLCSPETVTQVRRIIFLSICLFRIRF